MHLHRFGNATIKTKTYQVQLYCRRRQSRDSVRLHTLSEIGATADIVDTINLTRSTG